MKQKQCSPGVFALGLFGLTIGCATPLLFLPQAHAQVSRDLIDEYCTYCHNFEDQAGGVAFDIMDTTRLAQDDAGRRCRIHGRHSDRRSTR